MSARLDYVNRNLKRYDRNLFCSKSRDSIFKIFRKSRRVITVVKTPEYTLSNTVNADEYVFSLTDNWKADGASREWGAEKILERLKSIDIWDDPDFFDNLDRENEKVDETKKKDFRNETEAALLDNKRAIQKGFSDINTSTLNFSDKAKKSLR